MNITATNNPPLDYIILLCKLSWIHKFYCWVQEWVTYIVPFCIHKELDEKKPYIHFEEKPFSVDKWKILPLNFLERNSDCKKYIWLIFS